MSILKGSYLGSETLKFIGKRLIIGLRGGELLEKCLKLSVKVVWDVFVSSFRKEVICCNMNRHNLMFVASCKTCFIVDSHEWCQGVRVIQFSHLQMLCNSHPTRQYMSQTRTTGL